LAAGVVEVDLLDFDADAGAEERVAMAILLVAAASPGGGASLAGGHYCPSKPIVASEGFALTPHRVGLGGGLGRVRAPTRLGLVNAVALTGPRSLGGRRIEKRSSEIRPLRMAQDRLFRTNQGVRDP
jgi:hypothetical protein